VNDITARDWQNKHMQWHMGKSFDTFCPMVTKLIEQLSFQLIFTFPGLARTHGTNMGLCRYCRRMPHDLNFFRIFE
ncbi:MAG: hypothetical protein EBY02_04425, partial [Burkholderiaceae bacterium]|nr:hypothetical protein [Burkholderiaceae bacterium]